MNNKIVEQSIGLVPKKLYWDQADIPNYVLTVNGIDIKYKGKVVTTTTPVTAQINVNKPFQSVPNELERELGINSGFIDFESVEKIKENVQIYYNTAIIAYCDIVVK
jgi:hypothetical protein